MSFNKNTISDIFMYRLFQITKYVFSGRNVFKIQLHPKFIEDQNYKTFCNNHIMRCHQFCQLPSAPQMMHKPNHSRRYLMQKLSQKSFIKCSKRRSVTLMQLALMQSEVFFWPTEGARRTRLWSSEDKIEWLWVRGLAQTVP